MMTFVYIVDVFCSLSKKILGKSLFKRFAGMRTDQLHLKVESRPRELPVIKKLETV